MGKLGNIRKVNVRKQWAHEQVHFTPWLAREGNIQALGEVLGLELEVENIEVAVGPYSADILAKDVGTDSYVVVENQFGKTNHDHLGKLITYGSVLDATAIVWLAESFTEEHHRALDWLNDNTEDGLGFYGVILELWQIDDSLPAVKFNVISRPASLGRKEALAKAEGELSETRLLQLDFWTLFAKELKNRKVVPSTQRPRPQYWFDVALGRSGFNLSNIANTEKNRIGVRLYISNRAGEGALEELEKEKDAIEKEIGESLSWNPHPENRDKIVSLSRDCDLSNRDGWSEHIDWMVDQTSKFRRAFGPRVKLLNLAGNNAR